MVLKKLSELDDGGLITAGDQILIARSGQNYKIDGAQIANTVAKVANTVERLDALEGAAESGIAEAPLDGKTYARKDAAWVEASTGGGGGGSGISLFPIKPPVPADFTVVAGRDFSTITAGPSFTSFLRNYNGDSGGQLGAYRGIPVTGATWEVTATIRIPLRHGSTTGLAGVAVRDTAGKLYEFGIEANSNAPQLSILRMSDNGTTYVGSGGSVSGMSRFEWYTIRMSKTANFFVFEFSPDYGLTWVSHQSYSLNDHLGTVDSVGLVMQTYGYSAPDSLVCAYWDLKYT